MRVPAQLVQNRHARNYLLTFTAALPEGVSVDAAEAEEDMDASAEDASADAGEPVRVRIILQRACPPPPASRAHSSSFAVPTLADSPSAARALRPYTIVLVL